MKTLQRLAVSCLMVVLAAGIVGVPNANAYTYTIVNEVGDTITHIWLHTVSAFCHDVNWYGSYSSGAPVTMSSASICLVDQAQAWGASGTYYPSHLPFGMTSTRFNIQPSGIWLDYN
jgi:hypothetical protein